MVVLSSDLEIDNLHVSFKTKDSLVHGVKGISLTCPVGKKTGIVGESGSGKSLLAMSILQLLPSNALVKGTCLYKGDNLYTLNKKQIAELRCREIALIPQNPFQSMNPVLTVGRQLLETVMRHEVCTKDEGLERVRKGLKTFGFKEPDKIMKRYAFQLSGGMNQRILTVMGLLCHPKWIIADEPTKGLDAMLRKSLYEEFETIAATYTNSILLITHDLLFAKKFCDYIAVFYRGEMIEWGECTQLFSAPKHPYTKALLASMPQGGMQAIQKNESSNVAIKQGCTFYECCPIRGKQCEEKQMLRTVTESCKVRCCQYD